MIGLPVLLLGRRIPKPPFRVNIESAQEEYVSGDEFSATINTSYFFDAPSRMPTFRGISSKRICILIVGKEKDGILFLGMNVHGVNGDASRSKKFVLKEKALPMKTECFRFNFLRTL